ncbi:MAG TPA: hypothetical protein VES39_05840 [Rhodospirillales bacterium]|nr:hypothetical protein [Rhodospirillales bacterium]
MRLWTAIVIACFAWFGSAEAAMHMSKQDQQILSQLTPAARKEVLSRLTPGQSVTALVETMVLNRLSLLYAEGRIVEVDLIEGVATVQNRDGTTKKVTFSIEEIVIRE